MTYFVSGAETGKSWQLSQYLYVCVICVGPADHGLADADQEIP